MELNGREVILSSAQVDEIKQTIEALEHLQGQASDEVKSLIKGLADVFGSDSQHIVRSMTLPELYQQIGISLLHYFGRLVRFIHPTIPVVVRVTQDGNYVKFEVEAPEQHLATIEETLENYGFALRGQLPLNELLPDPAQLMEWKQKLDLSALEVKITRDLLESPDGVRDESLEAFGADARTLHHLVGIGISGVNALAVAIGSVLEENRASINGALLVLQKKLEGKITADDEAEIKEALETVLRQEPEVFKTIHNIAAGSLVSGRTADTLLSWIVSLSGVLPH